MARRLSMILIGFGLLTFMGAPTLHAGTAAVNGPDYSELLGFAETQAPPDSAVAFGAAEKDFDRDLNRKNLAFLNKDKSLLGRIVSQLNGAKLKWQLITSSKRLLAVPEYRADYAQLFERYCHTAVDYLLDRIHMPNPYGRIVTLKGPLPALPETQDPRGITVYLVHNLVDEYIEQYLFFSQDNDGSKVKITLSNRARDGKVGSVTSLVTIGPDHQFEFSRVPYTVWQNNAQNPLNVLIVPIEETLHILMRPYTEKAMKADLVQAEPSSVDQVQQVVDGWIAVEEAIVGGVVWKVMPEVCDRFVHQDPAGRLTHALAEREEHPQYRLLRRAIKVVADLGVNQSLTVYRNSPLDFKRMISSPAAAEPAPNLQSALQPQGPAAG
jgi:hypothetical protein